jgi:hypothetical protein
MTYSTPESVPSGVPYTVIEVNGHPPRGLTDFIGQATFVVQRQTGQHSVSGEGVDDEGGVRFHEKDVRGDGKDIRVWHIHPATDTGFVAEAV